MIKKDDVISLVYSDQGVTLTLQAKALENAVAGQVFNALNPESKKIIQAVATGPGQAVVGPAGRSAQGRRPRQSFPARLPSLRIKMRSHRRLPLIVLTLVLPLAACASVSEAVKGPKMTPVGNPTPLVAEQPVGAVGLPRS